MRAAPWTASTASAGDHALRICQTTAAPASTRRTTPPTAVTASMPAPLARRASLASVVGRGGMACPQGQDDCGGVCTDLNTDAANCGLCGVACAAGETCQAGVCVGQPAAAALDCAGQGLTDCGGVCTDLNTDPANCGLCGFACAPGDRCEAGFCRGNGTEGCLAGQTDCGGGICADLASDPANCGGCGVACAAGETCQARLLHRTRGGGRPGLCRSRADRLRWGLYRHDLRSRQLWRMRQWLCRGRDVCRRWLRLGVSWLADACGQGPATSGVRSSSWDGGPVPRRVQPETTQPREGSRGWVARGSRRGLRRRRPWDTRPLPSSPERMTHRLFADNGCVSANGSPVTLRPAEKAPACCCFERG